MTKTYHPPHLLLHSLLVALSYWGTAVRMLLVGFVLVIAHILTALNTDTTLLSQASHFIYTTGSLLLLDAGYVTIARVLPISTELVDKIIFLLLLTALSVLVILPFFATLPVGLTVSVRWIFLVSLFVLALRLVLGLIFGHRTRWQ